MKLPRRVLDPPFLPLVMACFQSAGNAPSAVYFQKLSSLTMLIGIAEIGVGTIGIAFGHGAVFRAIVGCQVPIGLLNIGVSWFASRKWRRLASASASELAR